MIHSRSFYSQDKRHLLYRGAPDWWLYKEAQGFPHVSLLPLRTFIVELFQHDLNLPHGLPEVFLEPMVSLDKTLSGYYRNGLSAIYGPEGEQWKEIPYVGTRTDKLFMFAHLTNDWRTFAKLLDLHAFNFPATYTDSL